MNNHVKLYNLQNLLYIWISKFEKRSLENIKTHCDYLNDSYKLDFNYPIWEIFWPLVFNGLIDHVGKGYYALTKPLIIDYDKHFIYINYEPPIKYKQLSVGIYKAKELHNPRDFSVIKVNPLSILKKFPTVKDVVDIFPKSNRDEKGLKYYNMNCNRGIAKPNTEGLTRYFSIPEELYLREIPDRTINPEAFAISYCYSRAINKEINGIYNEKNKTLTVFTFAFPYLIYRTLLLHSLAYGKIPDKDRKYYRFDDVPELYVRQLNRIFCNSIKYE